MTKKIIVLAIFCSIFGFWFLKGYFIGYEVSIWFKPNITKQEAEKRTNELNGKSSGCYFGEDFHTDDFICYTTIYTNAISIKYILNDLRDDRKVFRADILQDLIGEYEDWII